MPGYGQGQIRVSAPSSSLAALTSRIVALVPSYLLLRSGAIAQVEQ
jgi:hypothetical protein